MVSHLTQETSQHLFSGPRDSTWHGHPTSSLSPAPAHKQISLVAFPGRTGSLFTCDSLLWRVFLSLSQSSQVFAEASLLQETFLPNLQPHLEHHDPPLPLYFSSGHLSSSLPVLTWHIFYIFMSICLTPSFLVAEVCFIQCWFSIILNRNKHSPIKVTEIHDCFQGYNADQNYQLFLELIWSWPISDLRFLPLDNKVLLVLRSLSGCWLCTATPNPLLFLVSLLVYFEHAEISTYKFINSDLKGFSMKAPGLLRC